MEVKETNNHVHKGIFKNNFSNRYLQETEKLREQELVTKYNKKVRH